MVHPARIHHEETFMSTEASAADTKLYPPPEELARSAHVGGRAAYDRLVAEADADYTGFWARQAREMVEWQTPFTQVLDESDAPFFKWFADGRLNASYNCLDRHVNAGRGDKVALIFEADDGEVTRVTYAELLSRVGQTANALKSLGVHKGDRVVIYMPMSIEGVVAMQACARIGATHSVVFGGFSAQSLRERIQDTGAVLVLTDDQQVRGGKHLPLKAIVDEALAMGGCEQVRNVVITRRTGGEIAFQAPRDQWMHQLLSGQSTDCEPEWVE